MCDLGLFVCEVGCVHARYFSVDVSEVFGAFVAEVVDYFAVLGSLGRPFMVREACAAERAVVPQVRYPCGGGALGGGWFVSVVLWGFGFW